MRKKDHLIPKINAQWFIVQLIWGQNKDCEGIHYWFILDWKIIRNKWSNDLFWLFFIKIRQKTKQNIDRIKKRLIISIGKEDRKNKMIYFWELFVLGENRGFILGIDLFIGFMTFIYTYIKFKNKCMASEPYSK